MQSAQPLILTVILNEEAFLFFNERRKTYFPPAINYLSAHLTLFHHLPPTEAKIQTDLQQWAKETSPLPLNVSAVVSIGKGVAYKIESEALVGLHKTAQRAWLPWLTPQDRQKLWPHVTVQNKVSPPAAKETLAVLQSGFAPFAAQALGFSLWFYEGGPWRLFQEYRFGK